MATNTTAMPYRSWDELPLMLRIEDLMHILDIGRNTAYELVRCGKIHGIHVKKQLRIPKEALIAYISAEN